MAQTDMSGALFTPEDVARARILQLELGNCTGCCDGRQNHAAADERWLMSLADRIQQYLDQQARIIHIPIDPGSLCRSPSVMTMTWHDGTPVSSSAAERILSGIPICDEEGG